MAMRSGGGGGGGEPSSAPEPGRWYPLRLGDSFKDSATSKFSTLRYEFKPASIDTTQAGVLHKSKENRVTVELHNNQPGKPKATFEGSSEDYKDNDGVLFFDGVTFRLERLHRMKRLRYVYSPGEPTTSTMGSTASMGSVVESQSPPLGKVAKLQSANRALALSVPVEVERIDIGSQDSSIGSKPSNKNTSQLSSTTTNSLPSPCPDPFERDNVDIIGGSDSVAARQSTDILGFDINVPNEVDIDDDNVVVDINGEPETGLNAAEALRAQVNSEGQQKQEESSSSSGSSSSSSSSGSDSGSESSSSGSDGSDADADSPSSGGNIDI